MSKNNKDGIPDDLDDLVIMHKKNVVKNKADHGKSHLDLIQRFLDEWVLTKDSWKTPRDPKKRKGWAYDWAEKTMHIVEKQRIYFNEVTSLRKQFPFTISEIDVSFSKAQFTAICQVIVRGIKKGKFFGADNEYIRFYWEPLKETANTIHEWATSRGEDVLSVNELKLQEKEGWSSIPAVELREILGFIVKSGRAKWVNRTETTIEITY